MIFNSNFAQETITTLALVTASWIAFILYKYFCPKSASLPPGPWNLPILGCLHKMDPKVPYLTLYNFAQKYGPIFSVKLGLLNVVVISDAKILKKVLIKDEALGRPPLFLFDAMFRRKGIAFAPVSLWRDQRKFVVNFLRTVGATKISSKRKVLENLVKIYVEEFIRNLKMQANIARLNPSAALANYVMSVAGTLFLGQSFNSDDKTRIILSDNYHKLAELTAVSGTLNFLPFLRFLPHFKRSLSSLLNATENIHQIISDCIKATENSMSKNTDETPSNLIEAFLRQQTKSNSEKIYNREQLHFLLFDMFGASTEIIVNALFWILLYLAKYPEVQNKVRQELATVLQNKSPEMEDLRSLPCTEATIAEIARIHTVAPLGFPHYAEKDLQIEGMTIRKGNMILPLLWAIHMDPKFWKNPEEFSPQRFLGPDGKFVQSEALLPFQTGRRVCVGEELTKMVVFLFVASVVKNFQIEACGSAGVDLSSTCGLTLIPKPQELVFRKL